MIAIKEVRLPDLVMAPVSKSHLQRELIISLLAKESSKLLGDFESLPADVEAALTVIKALGAVVNRQKLFIEITPPTNFNRKNLISLNVGESGFLLRNVAIFGLIFSETIEIFAQGTLVNRELHLDQDIFDQLGIVMKSKPNSWPLVLSKKSKEWPAVINMDASKTSQVASGLIITLASCNSRSQISFTTVVSRPYLEMTLASIRNRGKVCEWNANTIQIENGRLVGKTIEVLGDWSGAANLLAMGAIEGSVTVDGLVSNHNQSDEKILDVLAMYGAKIEKIDKRITARASEHKAFKFDVTHCPDLFPVLCVLAATAKGESIITGTNRLLSKESNRLESSLEMLKKMGCVSKNDGNSLKIIGGINKQEIRISTYKDHRLVLAAVVLSRVTSLKVCVNEFTSIDKSFPSLKPFVYF